MNLTSFKTNNVTNMNYMFCYCKKLNELNLSSFNTINVKKINYVLWLWKLVELDLSSFNFNNVYDMIDIFSYCFNLYIIKINKINF